MFWLGVSVAVAYCTIQPDVNGVVTAPDWWTSVPDAAFESCTTLRTFYRGDANLMSIGDFAFNGCMNLTYVDVGNIGEVGFEAFAYTSLTSLQFSWTLLTVDNLAFYYSTNLTTVNIPSKLCTIAENAFFKTGCNSTIFKPGSNVVNCTAKPSSHVETVSTV